MKPPFKLMAPAKDSLLRLVADSEGNRVTADLPEQVALKVLEALQETEESTVFYIRLTRRRTDKGDLMPPMLSYMRSFGNPWNRQEVEAAVAQIVYVASQTLSNLSLADATQATEKPLVAETVSAEKPKASKDVEEMYR